MLYRIGGYEGTFLTINCLFISGCSSSLVNLRKDLEKRTGVTGKAIRIEKVRYAGKEGKTPQGCPLAKWVRWLDPLHRLLIFILILFSIIL